MNKVATRVELSFDVAGSASLNQEERDRVLSVLRSRITLNGRLRISEQGSRSQWRNREKVVEKFVQILQSALRQSRKRVSTEATKASREGRLQSKRRIAEKKRQRRTGAAGRSEEW